MISLLVGGAGLEEVKRLHILGVSLDSKLTLETHLQEVMSKAARSLRVMLGARKLFDCPRLLKSGFNAYVFFQLVVLCPR